MFPSATMNHIPNVLLVDAELANEFHLARAVGDGLSNVAHVLLGQLRVAVLLALGRAHAEARSAWVAVAALLRSVGIVLGHGAQEQMRRVAAQAIVAPVADAHAIGDVSENERVSDPMHRNARAVGDTEDAVATLVLASRPLPALAGFTDAYSRPELGL